MQFVLGIVMRAKFKRIDAAVIAWIGAAIRVGFRNFYFELSRLEKYSESTIGRDRQFRHEGFRKKVHRRSRKLCVFTPTLLTQAWSRQVRHILTQPISHLHAEPVALCLAI